MGNGEGGRNWIVWVLLAAAGMAAGVLLARWALGPGRSAAPATAAAAARPAQEPAAPPAAPAAAPEPFDLPGDEPEGDSSVVWTKAASAPAPEPARQAPAAQAAPAEEKKSRELGFVYGALTAAAEKLLKNPKALAALFNNDYVVKGFLSRDTVKSATAGKAALAAYLKNPANLSKFMSKPAVQRGMKDRQLVNVMASTKLVGAMLDTPGGKALLKDPAAIAEVLKANPDLALLLSDPAIAMALAQNPKTAGVLGGLGAR